MADEDLPILLQGETGTGKSFLARVVHGLYFKKNSLFRTLDCATLSPYLVESELFGHEKGAFTGATEKKSGLFDLACGGTILLDEVENLNNDMQAKLLRVLDEKKFRRVGGTEDMEAYFQLISTTNVNVYDLLQSKTLRKDFYYRIASVAVTLPPLRDRPEDISTFAKHFLRFLGNKDKKKKLILTNESQRFLLNYHWPGNIRELNHTLLVAAKLTEGAELEAETFESIIGSQISTVNLNPQSLAEVEKDHIQRVLQHTGYKISRTAQILEIAENTLRAKMKKYKLHRQFS